MDLAQAELILNSKFGADGWDVNAYNSPAERQINKPILPVTSATNRMGAPRNWPGPDTPLVEAVFYSQDKNDHRMTFSSTDSAIEWLLRQDSKTGMVNV